MREIKFRAWEKPKEDEYGGKWEGVMHFSDQEHSKRRFEIAGFYLDSGYEEDDFTVMQYTGLKDKNGKEIYEGDIVVINSPRANETVEWHEEHAGFYPFCEQVFRAADSYSEWSIEECEIIGNIYENPELIKQ